jgi:hypothetical protein
VFPLSFIIKPHHKRNMGGSANQAADSGGPAAVTASQTTIVRASLAIFSASSVPLGTYARLLKRCQDVIRSKPDHLVLSESKE